MTDIQTWIFTISFAVACTVAAGYLVWLWRHDTATQTPPPETPSLEMGPDSVTVLEEHAGPACGRQCEPTPGLERIERLGQAAWHAWQAAGGRGRTKPEQALLEQFAPTDPGANQ